MRSKRDLPDELARRHGTSSSRCSTTSSIDMPLVSTTTAPDASMQWTVGAGRVLPVALDDRRLDLVDVAADLGDPPLAPGRVATP